MLTVIGVVGGLFVVCGALLYQRRGVAADARRVPPPGMLVDVGGHRLHVNVRGSGAPAVVFEAGIAASSLNWMHLHRETAAFTTAVAYDRAGLGWSEPGARPPSAAECASQLRAALATAGVRTPVVIVAHSFGSYVAQLFAARWPEDVSGIVLVDPITWEDWIQPSAGQRRALLGGALFARAGALLSGLGVVRFLLNRLTAGRAGAPRLVLSSFGSTATEAVTRIVGEVVKMPEEARPAIQAHWSRPRSFLAMARHFAALPSSAREVHDATGGAHAADGSSARPWTMPLVVLGACTVSASERERQRALAARSTRGRYEQVDGCGHWVHLDAPHRVLGTIEEVVQEARVVRS